MKNKENKKIKIAWKLQFPPKLHKIKRGTNMGIAMQSNKVNCKVSIGPVVFKWETQT